MAEKTLSLKKGKSLSLAKGVSKVRVVLEWEERVRTSRSTLSFDIDLMIIETDSYGKAISPDHLVFFNSDCHTRDGKLCDPEEAVVHSGDDTTGGNGGEECITSVGKLNQKVEKVLYMANIYDGVTRRQNFGMITNARVSVYEDDSDVPVVIYELGADFDTDSFLKIGYLERKSGNSYSFVPVGEGNNKELIDNLSGFGLNFE